MENTVTTTFVDDGLVHEENYKTNVDSDTLSAKDQDLASFFAKPYLAGVVNWNTASTNPRGTNLLVTKLWTLYTGVPAWVEKTRGWGLIRGTFCFKVEVNASPFHQGKLLLSINPLEANTTLTLTSNNAMRTTKLASLHQLPCVELDCGESACVLKYPYIAPSSWIDVATVAAAPEVSNSYDWGTARLTVLSPLDIGSGGFTDVNVAIYIWMEDVEFAAPLVPQGRKTAKSRYAIKSFSAVDKEKDVMQSGPLSKGLKAVGSAATSLGTIPFLAPVMAPAAWVSNLLAGVASSFGWSKPEIDNAPMLMSNQFNSFMGVSDGIDTAYSAALIRNHLVTPTDGDTIYDGDEMSFEFLKKRETYIGFFTWTDLANSGTDLLSKSVKPTEFVETGTVVHGTHTATFAVGPPFTYLARFFQCWRGSICLKFKIAKTTYHTGRLQITFTPGFAQTSPNTFNSMYSLREIIDLKEGNEICLKMPYLLPLNYLNYDQQSGWLNVKVLTELRHPETAASSVDILMYCHAGDDFELAIPYETTAAQVPFSPQMDLSGLKPQMNQVGGEEKVVEEVIGHEDEKSMTTLPAEQSIGEAFTSIKQLLNRAVPWFPTTAFTASTGSINIYPWYNSVMYSDNAGLVLPGTSWDPYALFAPMYMFYRGNARVHMSTTQTDTTTALTLASNQLTYGSLNPIMQQTTVAPFANATSLSHSPQGSLLGPVQRTNMVTSTQIASAGPGMSSWIAPYYSKYKTSVVGLSQGAAVLKLDRSAPQVALNIAAPAPALVTGNYFRSFCDDFKFSYFVGAPPVFISIT
jgi:hypothetical protein